MFPLRYYPNRHFPFRYFVNVGAEAAGSLTSNYGFLTEIYDNVDTVVVNFYNRESTISDGVPSYEYTTLTLQVNGFLFVGSSAERMVSEKLRPIVSAVILMNYTDYTTTIKNTAKCTVGNIDYSIVYVENIANQNEVMQISLKEFT